MFSFHHKIQYGINIRIIYSHIHPTCSSFHHILDLILLVLMAKSTTDPTQDPTNPLHLHHSDGLGLVLTSQTLDHKNYITRNKAMKLSGKNKITTSVIILFFLTKA
ncbi:hypothetical protein JHK86_053431 [Glycine max]|nr:hypothetical protein JHK86_053431 [Glycine max]